MICFCNKTELDLSAITLMGASVKTTDSPIGFFGTGLKFAIATLLRTGHKVEVLTKGKWNSITTKAVDLRGKSFPVVCLNGRKLGYTTELGKNWELWQAYRELASNARDEGDHLISDKKVDFESWGTVIRVEGAGIDEAHANRRMIFCEGEVLFRLEGVAEILRGASNCIFYRGVRVHNLDVESRFTWNILEYQPLTEDRTLRYTWTISELMGRVLAACDKEEIVQSVLCSDETTKETKADYSASSPSQQFMNVAARVSTNPSANQSAINLWRAKSSNSSLYADSVLDDEDLDCIEIAHGICKKINSHYSHDNPVPRIVEGMPEGVLGMARDGEILISREALFLGVGALAGTLYEEWAHTHLGFSDCSRDFQNHLLNRLVEQARKGK